MVSKTPLLEFTRKAVTLANKEVISYLHKEDPTATTNLVCIHGNCTSSDCYIPFIKKFEKANIYAPDLRGYGDSTYKTPVFTLTDFASDVKNFIDELKITNPILIGWSFGGAVVQQFLIDYPDAVKKAILLASVGATGLSYRARQLTTGELVSNPFFLALEKELKEGTGVIHEGSFYSYKSEMTTEEFQTFIAQALKQRNYRRTMVITGDMNLGKHFPKIKAEVLVIHGTKDVNVPYGIGQELVELHLKEKAKLKSIKGADHFLLSTYLEETCLIISDFLSIVT